MIRTYTSLAWTPYTPILLQSASVATIANASRFRLIDKTMFVEIDIQANSVGTATAAIQVTMPSLTDSPRGFNPKQNSASASPLGYGVGAFGGTVYHFECVYSQTLTNVPYVVLWRTDTTGNTGIGAAAPTAALAVGDRVLANISCEVQ